MSSLFKTDALNSFAALLPIYSNPGNEHDMFDYVKKLFVGMGFVDHELPLIYTEYQVHRRAGGDDTVYSRKVPNLGLSFRGEVGQPTYFFNAHLDHYFAGSITTELLCDGDWLVSDGKNLLAADCKMGIAIVYAWVKRMLAWDHVPSIDILFDTCEEPGLIGASEFVEQKMYLNMPFYQSYKAGKSVFAYSIDGAWSEEVGAQDHCYITRANAIVLGHYLSRNEHDQVCVAEGSKLHWRKLRKKEKNIIQNVKLVCPDFNLKNVEVVKFGATFILLNKILPCTLLPVGFKNYHTNKECYWLPYLNVHENKFDKSYDSSRI